MTNRSSSPGQIPLHLGYFKAPEADSVTPYRVARGTEVIELVTAGIVRHSVDGTGLRTGCGGLFWHCGGDETIHLTDRTDPYECLCLAWRVKSGDGRPAPRFSMIPDRQKTVELCREILTAYHDESVNRELLGGYIRTRLLWEIHWGEAQRSSPQMPASLRAAVALVESGFSRPGLSVIDLARAAEMSEPHLHALFREHIGQSPHRYLVLRRIREAKLMLTSTSQAIKVIAPECGFNHIETFHRAFRRHVLMTPFEYRRRHGRTAASLFPSM